MKETCILAGACHHTGRQLHCGQTQLNMGTCSTQPEILNTTGSWTLETLAQAHSLDIMETERGIHVTLLTADCKQVKYFSEIQMHIKKFNRKFWE